MSEENIFFNKEKRIFYLEDVIDAKSIAKITYNLLEIIEEDKANTKKLKEFELVPIKLFINSNGGYVTDGMSLVNIMLTSPTPIHTYCSGYAYSMGFTIFLAGHERYSYKYSSFMAHQVSSGSWGKLNDIKEEAEYLETYDKMLDEFILSRTKIPRTLYEKNKAMKKDFFIFGEDIEKYKIATIIN